MSLVVFADCLQGCNINEYQLARLASEAKRLHLEHLLSGMKANYHELPFANNSLDGAYQIEAFCHSTDLKKAYSEVRFFVLSNVVC